MDGLNMVELNKEICHKEKMCSQHTTDFKILFTNLLQPLFMITYNHGRAWAHIHMF